LKWKTDKSRLAIMADTVMIVNSGSSERKIVPILVPDPIIESVDFPKSVAAGDSASISFKLTHEKIPERMKYYSTTFAFEGRDTTFVTIPIELEQ
jgi:hypothetical protein